MNLLDLDELPAHLQVKILRMVAGISALAMARRWEISEAQYYRVERGIIQPKALWLNDARAAAAEANARALATLAEALDAAHEAGKLRADAPAEGDDPPSGDARRRPPSD